MRSHLYQKKYFYSIVYCLLRLGQNYVNNQCFVNNIGFVSCRRPEPFCVLMCRFSVLL